MPGQLERESTLIRSLTRHNTELHSTTIYNEAELLGGSASSQRIHVRKDLSGFETLEDTKVDHDHGNKRKSVVIQQYSFMAFARFYYNRICSTIDGDYEKIPMSIESALPPVDAGNSLQPAMIEETGSAVGQARNDRIQIDLEDEQSSHAETDAEARLKLMALFRVAITPHHLTSAIPEVFAYATKSLPAYVEAADPETKDFILERTQIRTVMFALLGLRKYG